MAGTEGYGPKPVPMPRQVASTLFRERSVTTLLTTHTAVQRQIPDSIPRDDVEVVSHPLARATKARWSPLQILEQMAQAEISERSRRSLETRLRLSGIKRFKPMADFEW